MRNNEETSGAKAGSFFVSDTSFMFGIMKDYDVELRCKTNPAKVIISLFMRPTKKGNSPCASKTRKFKHCL